MTWGNLEGFRENNINWGFPATSCHSLAFFKEKVCLNYQINDYGYDLFKCDQSKNKKKE